MPDAGGRNRSKSNASCSARGSSNARGSIFATAKRVIGSLVRSNSKVVRESRDSVIMLDSGSLIDED